MEILSARIETGVGIRVSRAHWADSVWNSVLRVAGMPEQRSKPETEPDLLMRKERAARCGLITHIPGVLRSAERSPFMSPQRPTARDFSSCGATTSTKTPLDKTVMPCSGTWTETTPSWNIMTMAAILPWTDFLTILPSVMPERILTIFFSPETVLVVMATGMCLEPSMRTTYGSTRQVAGTWLPVSLRAAISIGEERMEVGKMDNGRRTPIKRRFFRTISLVGVMALAIWTSWEVRSARASTL